MSVTLGVLILMGIVGSGCWSYSLREGLSSSPGRRQVRSVVTASPRPIQLCGLRLLEAVRGICRGYSVTRPAQVVVTPPSEEAETDPQETDPQESNSLGEDYQSDGDSSARVTLTVASPEGARLRREVERGRLRRNIVNECCKRACSTGHLLRYCARS